MEMFNNLKDLLHSTNLLGASSEKPAGSSPIDLDAGAKILTHFQKHWQDLHQINEENAEEATKLAEIINNLHTVITNLNINISKINQLLNTTPNIKQNIETCAKQIVDLHGSFEGVEEALISYEDAIETCELEQRKNNHRYQLTLYKEKKLSNLEKTRLELAAKHAQSVIEFELKQKKSLQERQQVFQEAFKNDLETYKALGIIPKIEVKNQSSALLEEIQLDMDDKELTEFLEEEN